MTHIVKLYYAIIYSVIIILNITCLHIRHSVSPGKKEPTNLTKSFTNMSQPLFEKLCMYSCLENYMGREGWGATVHGLQTVGLE